MGSQVWRYEEGEISIREVVDNVKHGWQLVENDKDSSPRLISLSAGYNG